MSSSNVDRARAASEVILNALGAGLTHTEAAALAGLTPKSVQRRLADPEFAAAVARLRAARVDEIAGQLTGMGSRAVSVLSELLESDKPALRLRAVELTLSWLSRLRREVDFDVRLSRLEGGSAGPGFGDDGDDADGGHHADS